MFKSFSERSGENTILSSSYNKKIKEGLGVNFIFKNTLIPFNKHRTISKCN